MSMLGRLFAPAKSRRDIEIEYLNRSVSRSDLERRMREIDAGKFRRF